MPTPSNRAAVLSEIAFRARRSYRQSAVSYMETAAALAETRELCEHGKWGLWLAKTGIPVRTASRLLRLHAEGIKSATVADLGARHVDELLGRCPEILALVDHETGEPLAGDEVVRMAEIVDGTQTVYEWAHGHASRIGDQATLDMIADAFPDCGTACKVDPC